MKIKKLTIGTLILLFLTLQTVGCSQAMVKATEDDNDWKYACQEDFYTQQSLNEETEITEATKLFFHDYFANNSMELRLLPVFSPGGTLDWGSLSDFIIANTYEEWDDGFITEEEFAMFIEKYFDGIKFGPKPGTGLIYQDGKYTISGGFSFHGSIIYELTNLEKGKTDDGRDKWKAHIKGYYFEELAASSEGDEHLSKNAKVVWAEMKKEENQGLSFWQVRDSLLLKDPGSKLDVNSEWTIEFTVNDPQGDVYFTYLSCASSWLGN